MRIWPLLGWLSKGLHPRVAATWAVGWGKGGWGGGGAWGVAWPGGAGRAAGAEEGPGL